MKIDSKNDFPRKMYLLGRSVTVHYLLCPKEKKFVTINIIKQKDYINYCVLRKISTRLFIGVLANEVILVYTYLGICD